MMATGTRIRGDEVGVFSPRMAPVDAIGPGEVGFVIGQIKNVNDMRMGDTVTDAVRPAAEPCPATQDRADGLLRHLPRRQRRYEELREALEKLQLNDA